MVVRIQKVVRGFLGRRRYKRIKRDEANARYQSNFIDQEHLFEFRFKGNGAAYLIQHWFRNLPYRRKRRWHHVYRRFVAKLKREKILRRGIRKSKGYSYTRRDLDNADVRLDAVAIVVHRITRGFLGRRRFQRFRRERELLLKILIEKAIVIQTMLRKTTVRAKYPLIGQRHRMLQAKRQKYEKNSKALRNYVGGQNRLKINNKVSDEIQSETDSDADSDDQHEHEEARIHTHRRYFVDGIFLRRRASFLFLHLKLGDAAYLRYLNQPALVIQCMWRCHKARMRYQSKIKFKKFKHITVISAWVTKVMRRRRKTKALQVIQPTWRRQVQYRWHKRACSIKIQTAWRTHFTRKRFRLLLLLRHFSMVKLVRWGKHMLRRRAIRATVRRRRQLLELRQAGLSCYTATLLRWTAYYMWQGVKNKNYTSPHELQKVFQTNSVNGGMESAKFVKIAKECKDLVSDSLTLNQIEIQFTKVKNPLEKRIDYLKFVELCINLAVLKFMGVDPSKLAGTGEDITATTATAVPAPTVVNNASAPSAPADSATKASFASTSAAAVPVSSANTAAASAPAECALSISSFTYAGLKGKAALATRFIAEVIYTVVDFKRAVEFLDSKHQSANYITKSLLRDNVLVIQRFVRNRLAVRTITSDLAKQKAGKTDRRRNEGAKVIQGFIRGFLGRRLIKRMAQGLYTKFIDGESEREYWCNPRTGRSYWTKPTLLGEFDCGMATRMPTPEERYAVQCNVCDAVTATCFCVQCDEPYCTMCYAMGHRAGHRKNHEHLLVDNCVQCEFQIGSRYCVSCKDTYCDSCFKFFHKKGRLRFHVMQRTCEACETCYDLAAQWKETLVPSSDNNFKLSKLWCNRCYRDEFGVLPQDVPVEKPPMLVKIEFYGRSVKVHKDKLEKEKRLADIAAAFENRKKELLRAKQDKAVRFIQRVYRGHRKRRSIADFLAERYQFMALRKEEATERAKITYKLTSMLGVAKSLRSDTPLERVMKLYPAYMHHILAMSLDNNWTYACRLLEEHEERLKSVPKTNVLQRTVARVSVAWNTSRHKHAEKTLEEATAAFRAASQSLSTAQESGALAPSKLAALKTAVTKTENQYTTAATSLSNAEVKLAAAQERLTDCVGPRGIQKLVEQRRREGVLLPFRVTIMRHSRLALVTQWEDDYYLTEEELAEMPPKPPGKWKQHLQESDFVRINGAQFRIVRSMMPPKKGASKKGMSSKNAASDNSTNSADDSTRVKEKDKDNSGDFSGSAPSKKKRRKLGSRKDGEDDSASTSKKKKKEGTSQRPSSAHSDGSDGHSSQGEDSEGNIKSGANKTANPFGLELELRTETTEDHITLDHPWLLGDVYNMEVYRVMPRVFYYKPLFFARRQIVQSYPVQKAVAIAAITLHKYSGFLEWLQTNFDDESETFASIGKKVQHNRDKRDQWLVLSKTIVQMSYDFTLRRNVYSTLAKVYRTGASIIKLLRGLVKTASAGTTESPFEYWKRSMEKVDVVCIIDKGGDNSTVLGEFKLDLKAPVEIMREFIRREFRTQLNTTIGESFLFFKVDPDTSAEEILLKENEYKTYAKTFCFEKTDAKTMVTSMTVLIIPDPNRGRVLIPEFAATDEEEKKNEEMEQLLV